MAASKPKKPTASTKKIIDITHVGDAASGTSWPVIITNRPVMKDPMMAEASEPTTEPNQPPMAAAETTSDVGEVAADSAEASAAVPLAPKKKLVIQPLNDDDESAPTEEPSAKPDEITEDTSNQSAADEPAADMATDEPAKELTEAEETTAPASSVKPGRSFEHNELSDDTNTDEPSSEPAVEAKPQLAGGALTPEQQKAVTAGTYFLPITTTETRRLRRDIIATIILLILLALIWVDIMLDAGTLHINGIHAVTNFF